MGAARFLGHLAYEIQRPKLYFTCSKNVSEWSSWWSIALSWDLLQDNTLRRMGCARSCGGLLLQVKVAPKQMEYLVTDADCSWQKSVEYGVCQNSLKLQKRVTRHAASGVVKHTGPFSISGHTSYGHSQQYILGHSPLSTCDVRTGRLCQVCEF